MTTNREVHTPAPAHDPLVAIESEQSVIGALMIDNRALPRIAGTITAGDFAEGRNGSGYGRIFSAIVELIEAGKPADPVTVIDVLRDKGHADDGFDLVHLINLTQSVPSANAIERYAEVIARKSARRQTAAKLDAARIANADPTADLHAITALILSAASVASTPGASPHEWVNHALAWKPPANLAELDRPVQFAVDDLIQAGKVGALVAAGGTGKTTLNLTLAICIATGRPFFGRHVKSGTFVLFSGDDPQLDLEVALARVAAAQVPTLTPAEVDLVRNHVRVISLQGLSGTKTFAAPDGSTVVGTGLNDLILQVLTPIPDLIGIALDTMRQFSGGSTNDEQVVKLTIAGATEIANRTGAFVVIPHHTGKQNYRDGVADMYAGSGSAAIADNCRFVLLLQEATWPEVESKVRRSGQETGNPLVLLSTRGSLLVKAPPPTFICRDGYRLMLIQGAVLGADERRAGRDREVLRAIRGGAQTKNAIYDVVRGKKKDAMVRIDDLIVRGFIANSSHAGNRSALVLTSTGARLVDAL